MSDRQSAERWKKRLLAWFRRQTKGRPIALPRRVEYELDDLVATVMDESEPDEQRIRSARFVVAYACTTLGAGRPIPDVVSSFIDAARERYFSDPRRDMERALRLVRSRRGNPRGAARVLSEEERAEAAQEIERRRRDQQPGRRRSVADITRDVAIEFSGSNPDDGEPRVSTRTLEKAAAQLRAADAIAHVLADPNMTDVEKLERLRALGVAITPHGRKKSRN